MKLKAEIELSDSDVAELVSILLRVPSKSKTLTKLQHQLAQTLQQTIIERAATMTREELTEVVTAIAIRVSQDAFASQREIAEQFAQYFGATIPSERARKHSNV